MPLNEYEFPTSKLANVQSQLEKLVEKNYYLHQSAKDAYRAYLLSYNSHQLKSIFNVHTLDLKAVGKSFGFTAPPRVSYPLCVFTVSYQINDAFSSSCLWNQQKTDFFDTIQCLVVLCLWLLDLTTIYLC